MKKYQVMSEYAERWGIDADMVVDDAEIERLAREWDCTVEELMEQVEEINK